MEEKDLIIEKLNNVSRTIVRELVIKHNLISYNCAICNIDNWNKKPISLHLDHIDGNRNNNKISNLRFLCPNCDSQTDTYCSNKIPKNMTKHKDLIFELYNQQKSLSHILTRIGMASSGPNYKQIRKILNLD